MGLRSVMAHGMRDRVTGRVGNRRNNGRARIARALYHDGQFARGELDKITGRIDTQFLDDGG